MIYFLCVSSCRSGAPPFFRRARKKIEVLEVIKIGENWGKLGKTGQNWGKLGKTGENCGKLGKIEETEFLAIFSSFHEFSSVLISFGQFWSVLVSFGQFWSVLNSLEIRYNLFTINFANFWKKNSKNFSNF